MNRAAPAAILLLAGCVASPLYTGPARTVHSGFARDGAARRDSDQGLTTGSEVPRDARGDPILSAVRLGSDNPQPPRHRRKHWFGL